MPIPDSAPEIPHVRDLTAPPEVGRLYRVPCLRHRLFLSHGRPVLPPQYEWLPVLLPPHDVDPPDSDRVHYHYDFRFFGPAQCAVIGETEASLQRDIVLAARPLIRATLRLSGDEWQPADRPMLCRRESPAPPATYRWDLGSDPPLPLPRLQRLEAAYASVRLKPGCLACPHKGAKLGDLPVKDGVVICPMHGLAWRLDSGELVRRTTDAGRCP